MQLIRISMSKYYLLFSSLIFSRSYSSNVDNIQSSLRQIQVIFRHGERTPHQGYPFDSVKEYPGGFEQLTNLGKNQAYELGKFLRTRYSTFLNHEYKREEIYARSSDSDRCIMTAQTLLAGLYLPKGTQTWNSHILWQPIPVHNFPEKYDQLLRKDSCRNFKEYQNEIENSPDVQKVLEENKNFIEYVSINSGISNISLCNLAHLYDTLLYQHTYHLLPEWMNETLFHHFEKFADFLFCSRYIKGNLPVLLSGRLLRHITTSMVMKRDNDMKYGKQKMLLYSTHDNTLGALLKLLNIFNDKMVPYNFALIIELHAVKNQYFLKFITRDAETQVVNTKVLPKLGDYFTLTDFINKVINRIPDSQSLNDLCNPIRQKTYPSLNEKIPIANHSMNPLFINENIKTAEI